MKGVLVESSLGSVLQFREVGKEFLEFAAMRVDTFPVPFDTTPRQCRKILVLKFLVETRDLMAEFL